MSRFRKLFGSSSARQAKSGAAEVAASPMPEPPGEPPQPTLGKRILIVDDDPIILKTTSQKLQSFGYVPLTAMDGSEAISVVRQDKPALLLLDINFPPDVAHGGAVAWDAFVIMAWLRRFEGTNKLPMIIITGSNAARYKEQALAAGAVGFFTKPIDHDALREAIESVIGDA
jgi:two-component system response regulator GlrR